MRGSQFMSDKELRQEIRRLERNIKKRVTQIEAMPDKALQDASKSFREFQKELPKDLRKVTRTSELVQYYRRLQGINQLKTSTIKGAKKAYETMGAIRETLDKLSEEKQNQFWEAYHKYYEEQGGYENFQYQVMEEVLTDIMYGEDVDTIVNTLIDKYKEALIEAEEYGGTDNAIEISFTKRLSKLSDF